MNLMGGDLSWTSMFQPTHSLADSVLRGTIIYLGLFALSRLRRLVHAGPAQVIRNGTILQAGLRHEMLTEDDLRAQLRLGGINDLANVQEAFIEENGQISIIQRC